MQESSDTSSLGAEKEEDEGEGEVVVYAPSRYSEVGEWSRSVERGREGDVESWEEDVEMETAGEDRYAITVGCKVLVLELFRNRKGNARSCCHGVA